MTAENALTFNGFFNDEVRVRHLSIVKSNAQTGVYGGGFAGQKYKGGLAYSGQSPMINNDLARRNARYAYHDSTQARAIVDRMVDTIVETGLTLKMEPDAEILGISQDQAQEFAEQANKRFHLWAMNKKCHRAERMNFYQAQLMTGLFQQRDNDYFVRLFYSTKKGLMNPLQFGFIDPFQIQGDSMTSTTGYQTTQGDGIEKDADGREIAYLCQVHKGNGLYENIRIPAYGPRSGLPMMLHGYRPEYAFQSRGYSRLASVLQEFQNITDFSLSHIKKAIAQSALTMYVKPSEDQPASDPLADITMPVVAGIGGGSASSDPTEPMDDGESDYNYVPMPEATYTVPGSIMMANLKEGEDIKAFQDTAPMQQYGNFVDSFVSYLAAAEGMPIEVLLMRFNENYSASRAAIILFWRVARIWRNWMQADFCDPIKEAWLSGEIARGKMIAPGWNDPTLRAAWCKCQWIGSPMPQIDPEKEAKANKMNAELGATDLDRIAIERDGSDGKANRQKLTRQYDELPIPPWSTGQKENTNGGNNPDDSEEED